MGRVKGGEEWLLVALGGSVGRSVEGREEWLFGWLALNIDMETLARGWLALVRDAETLNCGGLALIQKVICLIQKRLSVFSAANDFR